MAAKSHRTRCPDGIVQFFSFSFVKYLHSQRVIYSTNNALCSQLIMTAETIAILKILPLQNSTLGLSIKSGFITNRQKKNLSYTFKTKKIGFAHKIKPLQHINYHRVPFLSLHKTCSSPTLLFSRPPMVIITYQLANSISTKREGFCMSIKAGDLFAFEEQMKAVVCCFVTLMVRISMFMLLLVLSREL